MKIVKGYPPNIAAIALVFDVRNKPVVFTYGNTIYNPMDAGIPDDLMVHEQVHAKQQTNDRTAILAWWDRYLVDPEWRLTQELEAYRAQYQFFLSTNPSRQVRKHFLKRIAKDLSGPIYGYVISYENAVAQISS